MFIMPLSLLYLFNPILHHHLGISWSLKETHIWVFYKLLKISNSSFIIICYNVVAHSPGWNPISLIDPDFKKRNLHSKHMMNWIH